MQDAETSARKAEAAHKAKDIPARMVQMNGHVLSLHEPWSLIMPVTEVFEVSDSNRIKFRSYGTSHGIPRLDIIPCIGMGLSHYRPIIQIGISWDIPYLAIPSVGTGRNSSASHFMKKSE